MTRRLVRRQVFPVTTVTLNSPLPTTSTTRTSDGSVPSLTSPGLSVVNSTPSSRSTGSQPVSSPTPTPTPTPTSTPPSQIIPSVSTASSPSPTSPPPFSTNGPNGPVTVTETTSTTAFPTNGTSGSKGNSFLRNKALSGFVFGIAGLIGLVALVVAVTSYMRRRNRKKLVADASNFSFDPKYIEDKLSSSEKQRDPDFITPQDSGYGHNNYSSGSGATGRFTGVGTVGGIQRPGPHSSSIPTYVPQDYLGLDGAYPAQYHNLSNIPAGHSQMPNPYDMYGLGNSGVYSNGQVQHDPYHDPYQHDPFNTSGPSGDHPSMRDSSLPIPRQLQPGVIPAQGPTFAPHLSASPAPLNGSPSNTPTPAPPTSASLQHSASNHAAPGPPTAGALPDTFGRRDSDDDDAYGGALLAYESSPERRTLQVANM